ncbi:Flp pilus assembly protein TadD, contains TPR repeats [Palleronia marisminoris]|uniref:Photosystem I assembly protein Ycf3 n=1 Tax=Palleronia marisminoris TaxID=315423 RepID=A0A1Y5T316_9RHOB|nr:tetratricopeptide repeat protein [Palleronia marisminoris]SFH14947.1 Flp pilus assembly protein TadD, contains TPR repeats [Palleronia marisminoris]SLN54654.1 Photosystem I assembly protein Ycf3 [Palleronia marisminoris]
MRHTLILALCLGGVMTLSACGGRSGNADVDRALKDLNVVDSANLNQVMLASSDPREAVQYFRKAVADNPDRIDLQRGLAQALIRAKQPGQAASVWARVAESRGAEPDDRLALADALIRSDDWASASAQLARVPDSHRTFQRYRLEAMIADSRGDWTAADSLYQTAVGLTTQPAGTLNNWGFSKLSRGQPTEAESLFAEALSYEPGLFTAKNNLALARGSQRNYELPVVQMSQVERAQLLHTLALSAIKQGDVSVGEGLLRDAIDTHPQHFDAAQVALDALGSNVTN